ncbi:MAG: site-specific integrase [Jatrophihabitans sp.]|uniref:site-specific integrase n=1 Tax=Jatrophihabitans sp. TaxID=1932789 RepID=UPI003F7E816F
MATILRKCLQAAVDQEGLLAVNPAAKVKPPRVEARADRHQTVQAWTSDQVGAFLARSRHQRHHVGWHLLVMTGMRRGEALGLGWDAIDLDLGAVSIRRTLVDVRPGGVPVWSDPKTDRGRRVVRLDDGTVAKLRAHRAAQAEERLLVGAGYRDHGLVFAMPDGRPIHPDRFSREFTQTVGRSDLPEIRLHDLRHTWATLALQAGVHPKVVQERLGHSNIAITLDIYSHVIPSMESDAADRVAALIAGS